MCRTSRATRHLYFVVDNVGLPYLPGVAHKNCRFWAAVLGQPQVLHVSHDSNAMGENTPQPETRQRRAFLREVEAMARLRSPNTVTLYGAVMSSPDRMVLVMELLVGGDLLTKLRESQQRLPEDQSRRIIRDICTGMAFLHSKNTVHGDLKSANVLLDGNGRAKVMILVIFLTFASCDAVRVYLRYERKLPRFRSGFHMDCSCGIAC